MLAYAKRLFMLLWVIMTPSVTRVPLRVMRELKKQGKQRLPMTIQKGVDKGRINRNGLALIKTWLGSEMITRKNGQFFINSFLPPFPGPAYERMFTSLLSGRRLSPVSAYIAATRKCHLKCWHCSFKGHAQADMSADQLGRIIDQLVDLGTSIIGFTGGEPMLCKELKTHIAHAHRLGTATVLFTTGLNIDRDEAVRLRDAGLDIFCCSLDGEEADHDRLRGRTGAFKTTLQAIEYAKAAGMYTMLSSVADRHFIADKVYLRLYDVAASMGVDEYRLIEAMPCGRLAGSQEDVLLSPADVAELRAFHVAVNRKYRLPKVCAFNQIESPELIGCGAGTQHMFIDNAGQVCPCDFTPLSFGDATAEPLGTIWERMNAAFTLPRRDCFIQTNRDKVAAAVRENSGVIPLPVQKSQAICAACPFDGMPDYFRLVAGHLEQKI